MLFLILKIEGDDPRDLRPVTVVDYEGDEPLEALPQGFDGTDGRYAILNWDERLEADLGHGPVEVTAVETPKQRAEAKPAEDEAPAASMEGER